MKLEIAELPVTMDILEELRRDPMINRDNLVIDDPDVVAYEVELYRAAGGTTIVDLTLPVMGRNPEALKRLAMKTGVNIVMGTGHYIQPTHPPYVAAATAEQLAQEIIAEVREGVQGTGIRPGIIGEVGTSGDIHEDERKMLHAAVLAQAETGLAINIHPPVPFGESPLGVIRVLEDAGAQLDRVVISHMDFRIHDESLHRAVADKGVTLSYDRFGKEHSWESYVDATYSPDRIHFREETDWDVTALITRLVRDGYSDRIVLSHDIGLKICLKTYGGGGLIFVQHHVLRYLREQGVSEDDIEQMTIRNNQRLLTIPGAEDPSADVLSDATVVPRQAEG
jgi:phosphotriesterase-related protein